jgi:hypothetical protein
MIVAAFFLSGCEAINRIFDPALAYKKIFVVYMAANNDLDGSAVLDMNEMIAGCNGLPSDVTVIVLWSRRVGHADNYGEWDDTRLFRLDGDANNRAWTELDCPSLGLTTLYTDEYLNLSDSSVLNRLLLYLRNEYCAEEWFLDIWNHGGGWYNSAIAQSREIAYDESSGKYMGLMALREACLIGDAEPIIHFDAICTDACSMGNLESAANFLDICDYYVASQDDIPSDGWCYDTVLPTLLGVDGDIESRLIAVGDNLINSWSESQTGLTICRVDDEQSMARFLSELKAADVQSLNIESVRTARAASAVLAETSVDSNILTNVIADYDAMLKAVILYAYPATRSGLSIYFPQYPLYDAYWEGYSPENVYMLSGFPFNTLLKDYAQTPTSYIDTSEPNGSKETAVPLSSDGEHSYIWCSEDIDWYYAITSDSFAVELTLPESVDYDLEVTFLDDSGKEIKLTSTNAPEETERIVIPASGRDPAQRVFIKVYPCYYLFSQSEPYSLRLVP